MKKVLDSKRKLAAVFFRLMFFSFVANPKNMMVTYQQFPRIRYVSQVSVISFVELAGSSRSLSTKYFISPPIQTQYVMQGMGGRRSVVKDASCTGLT